MGSGPAVTPSGESGGASGARTRGHSEHLCHAPAFICTMTQRRKIKLLVLVGGADLACFALGNMHYGETWSGLGVLGLFLFLALFEFL